MPFMIGLGSRYSPTRNFNQNNQPAGPRYETRTSTVVKQGCQALQRDC